MLRGSESRRNATRIWEGGLIPCRSKMCTGRRPGQELHRGLRVTMIELRAGFRIHMVLKILQMSFYKKEMPDGKQQREREGGVGWIIRQFAGYVMSAR